MHLSRRILDRVGGLPRHRDGSQDGLFARWTDRARDAMALAQGEAKRLEHDYVGTEHLLLGLIAKRDGIASQVLTGLGVQLGQARSSVEAAVGRGPGVAAGEVRLTPRLKRALELSATEARNLDHHYIGTEHLLLGILREREGVGAEVLRDLGVGIAEVRARVVTMIGRGSKT